MAIKYGDGLYGDGLYGGTLTTTIQTTVVPNRVLVSVTGMSGDNLEQASLFREIAGVRTQVRGAVEVDVTGDDTLVRTDAEQPFGAAYRYVAVFTDTGGLSYEMFSASITVTATSDVLSDAVTALAAAVTIQQWPEKSRTRESTVFNVGGRTVVVSGPHTGFAADIRFLTKTLTDRDNLLKLLGAATSSVVLLRQQESKFDIGSVYAAVLSDSEQRVALPDNAHRSWLLNVVETEPWPLALEARGFTLGDINNTYLNATLRAIADDFPPPETMLDIAQAEFATS